MSWNNSAHFTLTNYHTAEQTQCTVHTHFMLTSSSPLTDTTMQYQQTEHIMKQPRTLYTLTNSPPLTDTTMTYFYNKLNISRHSSAHFSLTETHLLWPTLQCSITNSTDIIMWQIQTWHSQTHSLCEAPHTVKQTPDTFTVYTNYMGAGIACWLERLTHDRKVVSLNPGRSGGRIFFSRVNFVCWLLFGVRSTPTLPQRHVKDPGHSTESAGGRNTRIPLTQWSWSGLTIPLSRHCVGTYQETSSHATHQRTQGHSHLSLLSHCGLILA